MPDYDDPSTWRYFDSDPLPIEQQTIRPRPIPYPTPQQVPIRRNRVGEVPPWAVEPIRAYTETERSIGRTLDAMSSQSERDLYYRKILEHMALKSKDYFDPLSAYEYLYGMKTKPVERKPNEEDMFASRLDDPNIEYVLCVRRGRPIRSTKIDGKFHKITFPNAKQAKACADELNEKYFTEYDKYFDRENKARLSYRTMPDTVRTGMLEVISKYAVLTPVTD